MNQRNNLTNSELVLAPDNSMYHIRLKPEMIADNIILVGDPARVDLVASFFDTKKYETHNREIHSCTGEYKGKSITAISTGMGVDNIDIVVTELDACVNIDLKTRELIWLNIGRDSNSIIAAANNMEFLVDYFNMCDVINLKSFFTMMATEVVDSIEDADVIVSDTVEDTFNGEKQVIRSYDLDKLLAFLNA